MNFTKPETRSGGYYELAIELGNRSDERLLTAMQAMWQHPSLNGCYIDRSRVIPTKYGILPLD
jgi:hypothetical protein